MAEALLPAGRRLCQDVPRIDGDHRLGLLRHRQVREVRELHGALRLRADRGHGDDVAPMAGAQGRRVRPAHRRTDGAGNSPRQAAPGGICVLAPRRARTRGHSTGRETGSTRGGGVKPSATAARPNRIRITPGRVHARADRPSDAPRGRARLRFRLTCVTRIFEKSVFTKFAHGPRAHLRGGADVWGTSLRRGSPFPAILTVIALLFFFGPSATRAKSAVPGTTQGCRWRLRYWGHKKK